VIVTKTWCATMAKRLENLGCNYYCRNCCQKHCELSWQTYNQFSFSLHFM